MRMLIVMTLQLAFAGAAFAAPPQAADTQTAVLAGGCFWGVEGVYEHMRGVKKVVSGYAGGDSSTATYKKVGTGKTGHAESVQITFDPKEVSYGEILRVFFSVAHDPTQLNRQGPDTGPQYRSAIFYVNDAQRNLAKSYIADLNKSGKFSGAIVTQVDPLKAFYPAESYHQDFMANNPRHPYILFHDVPKVREFKRLYPEYYRDP
jgi:peptide-methionine (S)-S-oxide reductase